MLNVFLVMLERMTIAEIFFFLLELAIIRHYSFGLFIIHVLAALITAGQTNLDGDLVFIILADPSK